MPNINIDDAYILNETGAQVDKVTGLFTKNENATMGEKQMARLNIAAGGSNDNLLDNAYFVGGGSQLGDGIFPINQRGQTSYTGIVNGMDRWRGWTAESTVTLQPDGVHITGTGSIGFISFLPSTFRTYLQNQTITFSVLFTDGTLLAKTAALGATDAWIRGVGSNGIRVEFAFASAPYFLIHNTSGQSFGVVAAKLEKGTVSTLANDVPPNFGEELRKCQRYLYIPTFPWYAWTGTLAMATSATEFNWVINTPVPMRQGVIPTIGITGSVYINNTAVSNLTIGNYPVGTLVKISGKSAGMTSGQLYPVNTSADNVSVILSAEL